MNLSCRLSALRGRAPCDGGLGQAGVHAAIRPHFLFNTLNTAIALVRQDPARAEAVLQDLADLFRHALTGDPGEAVPLAREVSLARRYLAIEQARFGERLRVDWRIGGRTGAARVPPLLLQPLVENAVRHGVEPSPQGACVRIATERVGAAVRITVANTVPAGPGPAGWGFAQDNLRERLASLHEARCRFQAALEDGVYRVEVEVPA